MFSHTSASGKLLLIMYVDDIIITGDDKKGIDDLKRYLQNSFQTKGLGKLCYFLGIEVARSKEGIILSQKMSWIFCKKQACLDRIKPVVTPIDHNVKFYEDQGSYYLILRDIIVWLVI